MDSPVSHVQIAVHDLHRHLAVISADAARSASQGYSVPVPSLDVPMNVTANNSGPWSCGNCTLINNARATCCSACGAAATTTSSAAATATPSVCSEPWSCPTCTLTNAA